MRTATRLTVIAISVMLIAAVTSAGAIAAGFLGPGHYQSSFASANGAWFEDTQGNPIQVIVNVNRDTFVFRPTTAGGTPLVQHATVLQILLFTYGGPVNGSACFVIPDADFAVGNNVQSASLNTTLSAAEACQGRAVPLASVLGAGPEIGAGDVGGITMPLTVQITWTGLGVTSTNNSAGLTSCGGFRTEMHFASSSASASTSGLLTLFDRSTIALPVRNQAAVRKGSSVLDVQGEPNPACFGI